MSFAYPTTHQTQADSARHRASKHKKIGRVIAHQNITRWNAPSRVKKQADSAHHRASKHKQIGRVIARQNITRKSASSRVKTRPGSARVKRQSDKSRHRAPKHNQVARAIAHQNQTSTTISPTKIQDLRNSSVCSHLLDGVSKKSTFNSAINYRNDPLPPMSTSA